MSEKKLKPALTVVVAFIWILTALGQRTQLKPEHTEDWSREPAVVTPGKGTLPPSDAIVLYGGPEDISHWVSVEDNSPAAWAAGEFLTVTPGSGDIRTRESFGDVQLHIEWRTPEMVTGDGQGRGNSGVFLMGRYEVQVLDSYENETYYNGQAASIYKDQIPLVNASRPPGEWQTYDIIFKAPVFKDDGTVSYPAYITVIHNGVLVQNHVAIQGTTDYIGIHRYTPHAPELPLKLQDHGNPVSFRNIWIREL